MKNIQVIEKFNNKAVNAFDNKGIFYGELLGEEESGTFNGLDYMLVLMRTERNKNKPLFLWVALPENDETRNYIKENQGKKIYIEGYMCVTYTFNNKAVSHTFVVPEILEVLEEVEDVEFERHEDFYMSYTMGNRVILQGVVSGEPWREYISNVNNNVTRFKLEIDIKGKKRSIYCTMWDTVNDIESFKEGMKVKVIGSYTMLKKERGLVIKDGVVVESRKNKLDSYVVVIQKIEQL